MRLHWSSWEVKFKKKTKHLKVESMRVHGRWRFRKRHAVIKVESMGGGGLERDMLS